MKVIHQRILGARVTTKRKLDWQVLPVIAGSGAIRFVGTGRSSRILHKDRADWSVLDLRRGFTSIPVPSR